MSSLFSMTAVLLGAFGMAGCQRLAVVAPETPCCEREQGGGQEHRDAAAEPASYNCSINTATPAPPPSGATGNNEGIERRLEGLTRRIDELVSAQKGRAANGDDSFLAFNLGQLSTQVAQISNMVGELRRAPPPNGGNPCCCAVEPSGRDKAPSTLPVAIATVLGALLAAVASALSLIIAKENHVSEYRKELLEALRNDLASAIANGIYVTGEEISPNLANASYLENAKIEASRAYSSVALRIRRADYKTADSLVAALHSARSVFLNEPPQSSKQVRHINMQSECNSLRTAGEAYMNEIWNGIVDGDKRFQRYKTFTLGMVACLVLVLVVLGTLLLRGS